VFSPFFFTFVLSLLFLAHVVSSLAYPNLLRNKMLSCCCCCAYVADANGQTECEEHPEKKEVQTAR
jgi:hypothetical protein